jgi:hypothetical protein
VRTALKAGALLLLVLALVACRGGAAREPDTPPTVQPDPTGEPSPALEQALPEVIGEVVVPEPQQVGAEVTPVPLGVRPAVGFVGRPVERAASAEGQVDPTTFLLSRHLYRSLLDPRTGETMLASDWTMRGSRATFRLPPDGVWSDGRPLRAGDLVIRLRRAIEGGELVGVREVSVIDEYVFEVRLTAASCRDLMMLGTWPIQDLPEWPPVRTSGQLVVEEISTDAWAVGVQGLPPRFTYHAFRSEIELRAAWERGDITSILGASRLSMGPLPGAHLPSQQPGPLLATLLFRLDDSILSNRAVREALTLATDRGALFSEAYGFAPSGLPSALLPPGHWAATPGSLPLNPERARELLDQAGWRDRDGDGVRENVEGEQLQLILSLPLSQDHRWERLARALAVQWADIGVELVPLLLEPNSLQERLHTERWQVSLLSYAISADPDQRAFWTRPAEGDLVGEELNITGYQNRDVSRLLEEGAQVAGCRPAERAPFYHEAWGQLLNDRPLWPLFPLPLDEVHRPGVEWRLPDGS